MLGVFVGFFFLLSVIIKKKSPKDYCWQLFKSQYYFRHYIVICVKSGHSEPKMIFLGFIIDYHSPIDSN